MTDAEAREYLIEMLAKMIRDADTWRVRIDNGMWAEPDTAGWNVRGLDGNTTITLSLYTEKNRTPLPPECAKMRDAMLGLYAD